MEGTKCQGDTQPPLGLSRLTEDRIYQLTGSDLLGYGVGIGVSAIVFVSAVLASAMAADLLFAPKPRDPSAAFALATLLTGIAVAVFGLWLFWKPRLYPWLDSREVFTGDGGDAGETGETVGHRLCAWDFRTDAPGDRRVGSGGATGAAVHIRESKSATVADLTGQHTGEAREVPGTKFKRQVFRLTGDDLWTYGLWTGATTLGLFLALVLGVWISEPLHGRWGGWGDLLVIVMGLSALAAVSGVVWRIWRPILSRWLDAKRLAGEEETGELTQEA